MTASVLTSEEVQALRDVTSGEATQGPEDIDLAKSDRSLRRHVSALERRLADLTSTVGQRISRAKARSA